MDNFFYWLLLFGVGNIALYLVGWAWQNKVAPHDWGRLIAGMGVGLYAWVLSFYFLMKLFERT